MKVSVIIPCYNQAHFLTECLESVKAQTHKDIEIIVVDDGSDDYDVDYVAQSLGARCIIQENKGLPAARNAGIKVATGDYILPLDADDKLPPDYIEKLLTLNADIAVGGMQCFGDTDKLTFDKPFTLERAKESKSMPQCALYKKDCWQKVGGYDESMRLGGEDYDFWIRALKEGFKFKVTHDTFYYYRIHKESMSIMTTGPNSKKIKEFIKKKHNDIYKNNNMKINTKTQIKNLKGEDIGLIIGDALAEIILGVKDTLKIKRHVMATNFTTKDEVELDAGDIDLLVKACEKDVESFGKLNTLITAQLLTLLK